ncbi:MAG: hypothetical protein RMJ98_03760 [Myxococcales bacterium]|nr:hypothetical protein [Polyangiaceae bacterium]MDW8248405.1 hypothetical protein [Myxococcales bacterium]
MTPPSPLELMALADGELEEPRKTEVERWLAERPEQQRRQQRREAFLRLVAESAKTHLSPPSSPDLTDAILAAVEREGFGRETTPIQSGLRSRRPPAQVIQLNGWSTSRKLLGSVAFTAAAAAALIFWWSSAAPVYPPARPVEIASSRLPPPDIAEDDAVIGDESTTITSIDLGSQSGAVFYVRGQTTASAVLWIDDTPSPPSTP